MLLTPGTVLQQRYEIEREIGRGGMGAAGWAHDRHLRGSVAIKHFLVGGHIDAETERKLRRAFEQEAKLLAQLHHSGLPHVIDHFAEPAGQFLVMGYVEGLDLDAMLAQRGAPFPVEQVLGWAEQLLAALGYLHSRTPPVLHRDIKPQNLKLTPQGELILLDFGLARGSQSSAGTTLLSVVGYTLHYAPLEQIQGGGTSERSDLYAVAATLYRLLTGVVPPDALTRGALLLQGLPDPLKPASALNSAIPRHIDVVLQQALSMRPQERPASAQVLADQLQQRRQPQPARAIPQAATGAAQPLSTAPALSPSVPAASAQLRWPEDHSPPIAQHQPDLATMPFFLEDRGDSQRYLPHSSPAFSDLDAFSPKVIELVLTAVFFLLMVLFLAIF